MGEKSKQERREQLASMAGSVGHRHLADQLRDPINVELDALRAFKKRADRELAIAVVAFAAIVIGVAWYLLH